MRRILKATLAASIVWLEFHRELIVRVVKRVMKSFGDELTVPTP